MAMNRSGVVAAILNRPGTLGPAAGKRSRGVLPLTALRHDSASAAAAAITALDAGEWRGFNMVIVDAKGGYFIRGLAAGQPEMQPLGLGVSMVTAHDPNEMENPRTARHLARFQAVDPSPDDWSPWLEILSDRAGPRAAQINVVPSGGFGTVCASLVSWVGQQHPVWLFADGPPDEAPFRTVDLPASWG